MICDTCGKEIVYQIETYHEHGRNYCSKLCYVKMKYINPCQYVPMGHGSCWVCKNNCSSPYKECDCKHSTNGSIKCNWKLSPIYDKK
jgi:hypothetical protein